MFILSTFVPSEEYSTIAAREKTAKKKNYTIQGNVSTGKEFSQIDLSNKKAQKIVKKSIPLGKGGILISYNTQNFRDTQFYIPLFQTYNYHFLSQK